MNKIQIKQYKECIRKLENFIPERKEKKLLLGGKNKYFNEKEIFEWLAECVSLFSTLEVHQAVIDNFLKFFKPSVEEDGSFSYKRIGPFVTISYSDETYRLSVKINFHYITIAFLCARNNLNKLIEEERLVPKWIIKEFSSSDTLRHISDSLSSIEYCYQQRDSDGIITNCNTLLDSILNLDGDLRKKRKLGKKIMALITNEGLRAEFGASKDLVMALDGMRVIRNEKIIHKSESLKHDIPFLVSCSFAYLVTFFLECSIARGKIIKN